MSSANQETEQTSGEHYSLTQIAVNEAQGDDAVFDIHPQASTQPGMDFHPLRSSSSGSSLSGSSKRKRLLPRAYKRGGKNKPIIVRDSSSGDIQSKEVQRLQKKRSVDLKTIGIENTQTRSTAGPAESLNELCNLQTRVLQSLVNRNTNYEKKRKRKKAVKPKIMLTPSCSSQELSRLFNLPRCIEKGLSNAADNPLIGLGAIGITISDLEGPLASHEGEDKGIFESEFFSLKSSIEEESQVLGVSPLGTTAFSSKNILGTQEHDSVEQYNVSTLATHVQDMAVSSPSTIIVNITSDSSKVPVRQGNSADDLPRRTHQMSGPETAAYASVELGIPTTIPEVAATSVKWLVEDKALVKEMLATHGMLKEQREDIAEVEELMRNKRVRHRDRTPRETQAGDQFLFLDGLQSDTMLPSSILASSLASLNPELVDVTMDIYRLEKLSGIDVLRPVLFEFASSSTSSLSSPAERPMDKLHSSKMQCRIAWAAEDALYFSEGALTREIEAVSRRSEYICAKMDEKMMRNAQERAATTGKSEVVPRMWIDESRLEAQPVGQFREVAKGLEDATPKGVSAFDPVATVSKFLGIMAYPLKYIWRVAYGT